MYYSLKNFLNKYLILFLLLIIIFYSFKITEIDLITLFSGISISFDILKEMIPPDLSNIDTYLMLVLETIGVGATGSTIGILFSFPLAFLMAKNTSPNNYIYSIVKGGVNALRAIPELVYALILVSSIGIGSLPGIIAIILHTVGLATKFYAEAIESIDQKQVEAIKSTGSNSLQVIRHAIIPQIMPLFTGYTAYIYDHNIRVTVGLGIVGAGGIGIELYRRIRQFHYDKVATIIILIIIIVSLISKLSDYIRNSILEGKFLSKKTKIFDTFLTFLSIILIIASVSSIISQIPNIISALPRMFETLKYMMPPKIGDFKEYLRLTLETVGMAISGTIFASLIAFLIAIFSSKNIMKIGIIRSIFVEVANFLRAMPDIIFAIFFVVAIGLGPFPGVLALAFSSAGLLAKFYTEVIENIDEKQIEAIEATGANTLQKLRHAIIPQILPLFNSYNLYALDRNVRMSTVLGIVGAGGIGYLLSVTMKMMEYNKTTTIIIIMFLTILTADIISTKLRKKILE
ncbi:MAG: phosphonate ABC transporter, permease protein PhnE [Brevinematales bacterium]|nr:phosphonate ABC transporter, permease protein PhnE [Brevinematales bacterium]